MQSVDDLNAAADLMATLYDEVALLTSEGLDGSNVAVGGDPQPVTYGAAGVAGPTSEEPAIDGVAWSVVVPFDLAEIATHAGFLRDGVMRFTQPLADRIGPGLVPFVHGMSASDAG